MPQWDAQQLLEALFCRSKRNLPAEELLTGILHNRLGKVLIKSAGGGILTEGQLKNICDAVKSFEITLAEPMGMDCAQVTAGGVITADFDPMTLESKLVPGLYACGEVLDIDGDCGGYNLQWAWSSGRLAGSSAGKAAQ